jgi:hypothetical protein
MGNDPLGAVRRKTSPQSLKLAEIVWAVLPVCFEVPSTDIGSAAPVVLTYIVSAKLAVLVVWDALTATAACPSLVDVLPRVSVPLSCTS